MLVFAAVAYDTPPERETIEIDENLFPQIGEGDKDAFCLLYELAGNAVFS